MIWIKPTFKKVSCQVLDSDKSGSFLGGFWVQVVHLEIWNLKQKLDGGNSNIFYFHLYLGKWFPIWRAYFSDGVGSSWFNHQLEKITSPFLIPGTPFWGGLFFSERDPRKRRCAVSTVSTLALSHRICGSRPRGLRKRVFGQLLVVYKVGPY